MAFVLSVLGDVPVDSGALVVTSSILRICRLSISKVLIGVGLRACIYRDACACVFVSVCVYTVFLEKGWTIYSIYSLSVRHRCQQRRNIYELPASQIYSLDDHAKCIANIAKLL